MYPQLGARIEELLIISCFWMLVQHFIDFRQVSASGKSLQVEIVKLRQMSSSCYFKYNIMVLRSAVHTYIKVYELLSPYLSSLLPACCLVDTHP